MASLTYPGAEVLEDLRFEGSVSLLLGTAADPGRVWNWYARRLGVGAAPTSLGRRDFEAGRLLIGSRRAARAVGPDAPFATDESPQVMAVHQGEFAVTVVLSRATDGTSRVTVLVLAEALAPELPSPEQFAVISAQGASETMLEAGYAADFSMASLKEVDRVIDEHSDDGSAMGGGYFDPEHLPEDNRTAVRLFGLGCYVGEVLKRQYGGDWYAESGDLQEAVHSLRLRLPSGSEANPIGKVFKRFENGPEDSVEAFGYLLVVFAGGGAEEKPKKPKTGAKGKGPKGKKKKDS